MGGTRIQPKPNKCQKCGKPSMANRNGVFYCDLHNREQDAKEKKWPNRYKRIKSIIDSSYKIIAVIIGIITILSLLSFAFSSPSDSPLECNNDKGLCYETTLLRVIDGDTIKTQDNTSIRFALASAHELSESGGIEAKEFIESICPVGSSIIIDEDDSQLQGSYDRTIAKVICNGVSLNELLVENNHGIIDTRFCSSEFAQESWASDCN